ncbi:unnamed protein product, partial [Echinostoma caproni]|uniref:Cytochrome P450 n=1 Tax=Echinostoma caproni TaxID=27848 RepID=A0A183BB18_9TREM
MQSQIAKLFEIEFDENNQGVDLANSQVDKLALESVRSSATVVENHYQLRLPWNRNWREIPFNRYLAEKRLNHLRVRLERDPNLLWFIHENTKVDQWRYVPTGENPADLASRGINGRDNINLCRWLQGPNFLQKSIAHWPRGEMHWTADDSTYIETKVQATVMTTTSVIHPLDKLISYYSSWTKLKRASAWLLRFQRFILLKTDISNTKTLLYGSLNIRELEVAESALLRYVQRQAFSDIFDGLLRHANSFGTGVLKRSSMHNLCPVMKDGLLKVGGRLDNLDATQDRKRPVILPSYQLQATVMITTSAIHPLDKLISYYSSWTKLKRASAWLLRFQRFILLKTDISNTKTLLYGSLNIRELEVAESALLRYVQRQAFSDIFDGLLRHANSFGTGVLKRSSMHNLCPVMKDGLLKVGGRLDNLDAMQDRKRPVILPSRNPITDLIVRHYHLREGHMG